MTAVTGPLRGLRVIEFAGIGPGPFCAMLLSDLGADVIRIERPGAKDPAPNEFTLRGRSSVMLDLGDPDEGDLCLRLCDRAEVLIEGFRPGVMERRGLGPDVLLKRNPALVYGRVTGWGQDGPLAGSAGHDLNYAAISGAIHAIGMPDRPIPPLNLVGDYAGGAMFLATGLLAALAHARATGLGQVVDASMADGAAYLMTPTYMLRARGMWNDARRDNDLDGAAPNYDCYKCSDGEWIAVAPLEPRFLCILAQRIGLPLGIVADFEDRTRWSELCDILTHCFLQRTRGEWCSILEATDACFAPVLSLADAPRHPQNLARGTFVKLGDADCPAPAPRFSATPGAHRHPARPIGDGMTDAFERWAMAPANLPGMVREGP